MAVLTERKQVLRPGNKTDLLDPVTRAPTRSMPDGSLHGRIENLTYRGRGFFPDILVPKVLALWDADTPSLITRVDGLVASWRDEVAGYELVQPTAAARPAYVPTGLAGRPTVMFDGVNDFLTMESCPFPVGAAPAELWVLTENMLLDADNGNKRIFGYGGNSPNNSRLLLRYNSTPPNRFNLNVGTGAGAQGMNNLASALAGPSVVRGAIGPTTSRLDVNGSAGADTGCVPATVATRVRMGTDTADAPASFYLGKVSVAAITSPLTAEEAAVMLTALSARRSAG